MVKGFGCRVTRRLSAFVMRELPVMFAPLFTGAAPATKRTTSSDPVAASSQRHTFRVSRAPCFTLKNTQWA